MIMNLGGSSRLLFLCTRFFMIFCLSFFLSFSLGFPDK